MTEASVAASDPALLRPGVVAPCEVRDVVEDIAEAPLPKEFGEFPYTKPRLKGGGSYVMPNSGCTQKGQQAGSETSIPSS
jgi:hypothetical protein